MPQKLPLFSNPIPYNPQNQQKGEEMPSFSSLSNAHPFNQGPNKRAKKAKPQKRLRKRDLSSEEEEEETLNNELKDNSTSTSGSFNNPPNLYGFSFTPNFGSSLPGQQTSVGFDTHRLVNIPTPSTTSFVSNYQLFPPVPSSPPTSSGTKNPESPSPFGPQPGSNINLKVKKEKQEITEEYVPPSPSLGPQPGTSFIHQTTPGKFFPPQETGQSQQEKKTEGSYTRLLLLISLLYKQGKIIDEEKSRLKDLTLEKNDMLYSALEVLEIDQDIEEFTDTCRRIVKCTKL